MVYFSQSLMDFHSLVITK